METAAGSVSYTEADQPKLTRLEGGLIGEVRVYDVERVGQLKSVTVQKCGNPAEAACSTGSSLREVLEFAYTGTRANNGNVQSETIKMYSDAGGLAATAQQVFGYDGYNRLRSNR